VHHHEQRSQAPDAIEAGQPLPRRAGECWYRGGVRRLEHTLGRAAGGDGARCHLSAARYDPNALRKRLRNASIRQTGAFGPGRNPSPQPHPAILSSTAGSCAMTEIGTS